MGQHPDEPDRWSRPGGDPPPDAPGSGTQPIPQEGTRRIPQQGPPRYGYPPDHGQQPPPPYGQQPPPYGQPPPPPPYGQQAGFGYPGTGQWHQLPPEDLMRMNKPGIIPLRPLTLGEMFEGSLKTMRRNPEATIGMAVLVLAAMLLPSLLISSFLPQLASLGREDAIVLANLIPTLLTGIATLALSGFVIYVVSEAALGDRVSVGQTWRAVRGRLPALVGVTLLTGLLLVVVMVAVILVGVLLGLALGPIGVVLLVPYFLALVPLYLWFYARLALAPAAVVLERAGPVIGLKRSWALTRGRQAWRVLGIILLAGIVMAIFSFAVSSVLLFLLLSVVDLGTGSSDLQFYGEIVLNHLVSLIVNAIATPFTAGVTALLYLDQRIRREGLEVGLAKAAQERAAARRG